MGATPELRLYNTLTREKSPFAPIDSKNVRMYVCGPTVYDYAHIGNARPAIVFDVLYRLLRHVYGDAHVKYVRNITDVDDKINARALRDYPDMDLNAAIRLVTEKTYDQYQKDVKALGCLPPDVQPRATEHIAKMVEINQALIDKGHAYVAKGAEGKEVLFATASMPDYGQLSRRRLDEQQAGARIAVEAHKKNAADFVLWKESTGDQPGWHADYTFDGRTASIFGRPGWHIECSAMSAVHLGETFDIHGGGLDLIFPHHENEIAQSRCAHGTPAMAKVWMHNGFLQVEGKKMSKSDGNFVTIHELLETEKFGGRKWDGEVLRLAMLMTHYRQPIDFNMARLVEAANVLEKWYAAIDGLRPVLEDEDDASLEPDYDLVTILADDLNTSEAVQQLNRILSARHTMGGTMQIDHMRMFRKSANMMGFLFRTLPEWEEAKLGMNRNDINAWVQPEITRRHEMLKAKNFAEADRIRDDLLAKGIQLKDGKDPATGERVTTWEVKR